MNTYRKILLFVLVLIFFSTIYLNYYLFAYKDIYEQGSQVLKASGLIIFLTIISILYANVEIEIEGEHGWAQDLPTWTYGPEWMTKILNGKSITGYHTFFLVLFLPAMFHFPLFFTQWTVSKELVIIGAFFFFVVVEDLMWFVFNPKYGLKRFNSKNKNIWWHRNWFGPLPDLYIEGMLIALILFSIGLPYI